ncbi:MULTISPECIES: MBL fold metallo-hydrolase, partial [unclassified Actinomyces]
MILERTLAAVFGANCYVLAEGPGRPAVVVDPGAGASRGALALLRSNRLTLGAVLLTHGHADHVWDAQRLIDTAHTEGLLSSHDAVTAPVYVPEPDRYR